MRAAVIVCSFVFSFSSCFLLVTSGIRRDVPDDARPALKGMLGDDEQVMAAWDGSILQDGALLVLLTDQRVVKRDGDDVTSVALETVDTIIVNEDDGAIDVVTKAGGLKLPLRTSEERKAFAHLIQAQVQKRKRAVRPAPPPPPETTTTTTTPSSELHEVGGSGAP